ncbi:MAG: AbrB family transcriptional regulator [Hyphomicrobiales bacterium]|nr:MAG: AbrB family transcriptional regulator [Hyphomicrobiales bacterium]
MTATALPLRTVAVRTLLTIAISVAGGFVVSLFGVPGSWLMGGALAVAVAAIAGVKVMMPDWLRDLSFVLIGLSMGANVAKDSLQLIVQWPVTMAALLLELLIIVATTGYLLRKIFKVDRGTAYLSSFPGHLSFVMGMAAAGVGDPRQIVIIQVIRILLLTICVPIGALWLPVGQFSQAAIPDATPMMLIAMFAVCLLVGFAFTKLRVPAGYSLGAMAAATIAKLTGFYEGAIPDVLMIFTFVLVGGMIGARFEGITRSEIARASVGGLIGAFIAVAIVTVVAYAASTLVDMPFAQIWLGLSPGGLEAMGALGLALGLDSAFIAAHHVARLLLLTILIPVVTILVREREAPRASP